MLTHFEILFFLWGGSSKVAQQVKVLTAEFDKLSSVPETHVVKGEKQVPLFNLCRGKWEKAFTALETCEFAGVAPSGHRSWSCAPSSVVARAT